jgi:aspartyl protease family protein
MPTITPELQQIAIYAVAAAVLLMLLQRIPVVGRVIRFTFSLALLAFCIFLLIQHAPYEPNLARLSSGLGLDKQEVVGEEVRIRMAPDGHFWANTTINGVKRRMLIDSGATITAVSATTATQARIDRDADMVPIVLQTANGRAEAQPGTIDELRLGNIVARNLKVVSSPTLGNFDVLGMNFLSKLKSWRVEGKTLILVPNHPQPDQETASS